MIMEWCTPACSWDHGFFHWFNNGLVHVGEIRSFRAAIALDVGELEFSDPRISSASSALVKFIIDWNLNREYQLLGDNCQVFAEEMLTTLGMRLPQFADKTSAWGLWMSSLKTSKKKKAFFQESPTAAPIYFKRHSDLDEFVVARLQGRKISALSQRELPDFLLLKAFDRAFWLQLFSEAGSGQQTNTDYLPHEQCCPFGNPKDGSFPMGNPTEE